MLFEKIYSIAQDSALTMTFTANRETGTLTVVVIPKAIGENANPALHQPMSFEATPDELESQFAEALGSYSASRKSLADALKDAESVMAAAKSEVGSKTRKALKGASVKDAPASTVPVVVPESSGTSVAAATAEDNLFGE